MILILKTRPQPSGDRSGLNRRPVVSAELPSLLFASYSNER
ncbi:hypothetical protein AB395_0000813 [Sinorhizobium fredii CCBAU 45436]|nr:hypothetical protein AB395_0000813 [Sinorhizobium fredii CCBAU 45436]